MTPLVRRYFLGADLLAVAVALAVTGVVTVVVLVTWLQATGFAAVPVGLLLYLVVAAAGWALARRPGKAERHDAEAAGLETGFAEVREVRRQLAAGEPLGTTSQPIADALAEVVQARSRSVRTVTRVVVIVVAVFVVILVAGLNALDANAVIGAISSLVVVGTVVVAEWRRTTAIRRELVSPSR